jgi:antitoxin component YwqK of YwqJK toxin-antitoxin module
MRYHITFWLIIGLAVFLFGACAGPRASGYSKDRGFWKPNRSDRKGLAKGRWRTYYDDAKKQPFTSGQYRHGRPVRTFRYYAPTGALDHSEVYGDDGYCEVTYWYPSGKVARRGNAQWVTGAKGARFYWYGPWTSFAEDGRITAIQTYTDGTLTRAETYEDGQISKIETFDRNKLTRVEHYQKGSLIKVETFENGQRTGTTNTI